MTATVADRTARYTGDATTTVFAIPQYYSVAVYVDGVLKTAGVHYTLSGGSGAVGNCTFLAAPSSGAKIVIVSDTPLDQQTDLQDFEDSPADVVERMIDRAVLMAADTRDRQLRVIRGLLSGPSVAEMDFVGNPNSFFHINADGVPSLSSLGDLPFLSGSVPTSAFLKDSDDSDDIVAGVVNLFMTAKERLKLLQLGVSITDHDAVAGGEDADSLANTAAINAAATAAAGGTLVIPEGVFWIRSLITLKSNTIVYMHPGAVIKADVANWTGDKYIFRNENHDETELTDENIHLVGHGLIDAEGSTGDHHMWYMRYVDTSSIRGCVGRGGGNFGAFLACQDTLCEGAEAQDVGNCGFDHWDGARDAIVACCTVNGSGAQGLQATGTATDFANRDAWNVKFIGNTIKGVRNVGQVACAIIFNTVDAGSTIRRCLSMGNSISDCDLGLAMSGVGGQHTSLCDTFEDVDQLPIQIQDDSGIPDNCRILFPHLIDCNHSLAALALISIAGGNNNTVDGIRVTNAGAAPYARVVIVASGAVDTYIGIERAPAGTTTTLADSGTNTSYLNKLEAYGDWTAYTPTVGATTGTITTSSATGAYKRIGKTMHFRLSVTVTTNGTGAGNLTATLPADCVQLNRCVKVGTRTSDGTPIFARNPVTKNLLYLTKLLDGTYPAVDGSVIMVDGSYEID